MKCAIFVAFCNGASGRLSNRFLGAGPSRVILRDCMYHYAQMPLWPKGTNRLFAISIAGVADATFTIIQRPIRTIIFCAKLVSFCASGSICGKIHPSARVQAIASSLQRATALAALPKKPHPHVRRGLATAKLATIRRGRHPRNRAKNCGKPLGANKARALGNGRHRHIRAAQQLFRLLDAPRRISSKTVRRNRRGTWPPACAVPRRPLAKRLSH